MRPTRPSRALAALAAAGAVAGAALATAPRASAADPVTVVVAADIACAPAEPYGTGACAHDQTAALAASLDPTAVLLPGDIQYADGTVAQFTGDTGYTGTWSRLRDRTWPAAGNHEWRTAGAAGYRHVFDTRTGGRFYYSRDVGGAGPGAWHVIALDSDCAQVGGCGLDSPQVEWLQADLAANDRKPTIVFWHHPRHSSGAIGNVAAVDDLWEVSVRDPDVQIVLNGHDHGYERWHRMEAEGRQTTAGARQFVVGTGGRSLRCGTAPRNSRSAVYDCTSFGVLELTLRDTGYDWRFHPATGSFTDSGTSGLRPR